MDEKCVFKMKEQLTSSEVAADFFFSIQKGGKTLVLKKIS